MIIKESREPQPPCSAPVQGGPIVIAERQGLDKNFNIFHKQNVLIFKMRPTLDSCISLISKDTI